MRFLPRPPPSIFCPSKFKNKFVKTDYGVPGTNHVLPTNMTSKYSSGLSVSEFIKKISYINLSKKGIETLGPSVITLATNEGLDGHAKSIKKRLGEL